MIEIDNIAITIERKNIKNMYIRIKPPEGTVKVSVPYGISDEEVNKFIKSKRSWISKKILQIQNQPQPTELKFENNEKHLLWGKEYFLKLITQERNKKPYVDKNNIYLPVKSNFTRKMREKALIEFYRSEIKIAIPHILNNACKIVGKYPKEWRVKNMKTRWGSCNTNKKRIWLNLQLAKKPPECLEYVIFHELTHLYVPNHGKKFKSLLNKFYPNSKTVELLLKQS